MDKLKQTNVYYLLLNAYLIFAIVLVVYNNQLNLFSNLDNQISFLMVGIIVILFSAILFFIEQSFKLADYRELSFVGLANLFFILFAYYGQNLMVSMGAILVLMVLYLYHVMNQKKDGDYFILGIATVSLIGIYYGFNTSDQSVAEKYLFDLSHTDRRVLMSLSMSIVITCFILYIRPKIKLFEQIEKHLKVILGFIFVVQLTVLMTTMVAKAKIFETPTFDMGIFTQMFHNMAKGLGPVTTLERDRLLSHFSVHFSPIHYALLPIFSLFPRTETLEISQILVVASGVIPTYLITKKLALSPTLQKLWMILYLIMPSLTTGHLYDYHENCFLAPTLLWLFYAMLTENRLLIVVFTILTLIVKEDAAIYVISLGLFFILQSVFTLNKKTKVFIGVTSILLPTIYFIMVIHYLETVGTGAMTSRFSNFMIGDQEGLKYAVINALKNPVFTISSIFTYKKIIYLVTLLGSLGFLPLLQKHLIHYLLLLPLVVINLLSDWPYQADLFKQYHYGSSALIFLLAMIAFFHLRSVVQAANLKWAKQLLIFGLVTSMCLQVQLILPKLDKWQVYQDNQDHYDAIAQTLANIPQEASVLSFSNYTSALSHHTELYDIFYHQKGEVDPKIDYVVFEHVLMNGGSKEAEVVNKYMAANYVKSDLSSEFILILEKSK